MAVGAVVALLFSDYPADHPIPGYCDGGQVWTGPAVCPVAMSHDGRYLEIMF